MRPSTILAVALIALGVWGRMSPSKPIPIPTPARPSEALVVAVAPVGTILKDHPEDGHNLALLYAAMADVIARDQGKVVQTTA